MTDISSFAGAQLSLLEDELNAEIAESATLTSTLAPAALQRAGAALVGLTVGSMRTGLGGKMVLELEPDSATVSSKKTDGTALLPEHGIRTGDIVRVQTMTGGSAKKKEKTEAAKDGVEGVVSKVGQSSICVALDKEDPDIPNGRLWMYVLTAFAVSMVHLIKTCADMSHVLELSLRMISPIRGMAVDITYFIFSNTRCDL
jgi:DNA polymerase alpha-associated DNA helicase A